MKLIYDDNAFEQAKKLLNKSYKYFKVVVVTNYTNKNVDAIIDNFAQMFSENNKKAETAAVAVAPAPAQIGNGAQTVEDLIKAVMAESLKPAIEQALASVDKDIMELTKEQVSKEAKILVDKNLTEAVESVIREEVKRVMAKVGS